jgi:hypothetical protein
MDALSFRTFSEARKKEKGIMLLDIAAQKPRIPSSPKTITREPLHIGRHGQPMPDHFLREAITRDTNPRIICFGKRRMGSQKG